MMAPLFAGHDEASAESFLAASAGRVVYGSGAEAGALGTPSEQVKAIRALERDEREPHPRCSPNAAHSRVLSGRSAHPEFAGARAFQAPEGAREM